MSSEPAAHHPTSPNTYYLVFVGLIVLTALTATTSLLDLGEWHTPIGMAIAVAKATLIVLFFMHGLEAGRLVWMVIAVSILFLAILWSFTFTDYATRHWDAGVRNPKAHVASPFSGVRD